MRYYVDVFENNVDELVRGCFNQPPAFVVSSLTQFDADTLRGGNPLYTSYVCRCRIGLVELFFHSRCRIYNADVCVNL